jgi:hypothetical protein
MTLVTHKAKTDAELKKFGITIASVLVAFAAFLFWKSKPIAPWLLLAGLIFACAAFIVPRALRSVEAGWMWFGERMSRVMTAILMTLTFYLMVTPMAIVAHLVGRDRLGLKLDRAAKTYWIQVEPDGPHSRPFKPY